MDYLSLSTSRRVENFVDDRRSDVWSDLFLIVACCYCLSQPHKSVLPSLLDIVLSVCSLLTDNTNRATQIFLVPSSFFQVYSVF